MNKVLYACDLVPLQAECRARFDVSIGILKSNDEEEIKSPRLFNSDGCSIREDYAEAGRDTVAWMKKEGGGVGEIGRLENLVHCAGPVQCLSTVIASLRTRTGMLDVRA